MPSAPNCRATRQSSGVSALVRTFIRRPASAHTISVPKSPTSSGSTVGTRPAITSPEEPSSVMISPSRNSRLPARSTPAPTSMEIPPAPETQGRPIPRATTAACDVMPPRAVRMPRAACIPWISSGDVSTRTRMTSSPAAARVTALSAVNTTAPDAAPGDAGRPRVITSRAAFGSSVGCSNWSSAAGSIRNTASSCVISPSAAISTAIFSAAFAVRLPLRVCSIHSLPRSTVNSMSCMSR